MQRGGPWSDPYGTKGGSDSWVAMGLVAALLVACDGDRASAPSGQVGPVATTATTSTSSSTTTSTDTTTTAVKPNAGLGGASTSPTTHPVSAHTAYLTAVRAGTHPGFDRVVFDFQGGLPGFRVAYVDRPVREDGSGRLVDVDGAGVLEVRMERAATARLSGEGIDHTYQGPRRIRPSGTETVLEVVEIGDFEAVLRWVIGSRHVVPFKVTTLASPSRLVVDLKHPLNALSLSGWSEGGGRPHVGADRSCSCHSSVTQPSWDPGMAHSMRMRGAGMSAVEQARQEQERREEAAEHRKELSVRCSTDESGDEKCHRPSSVAAPRMVMGVFLAGLALVFIAQNSHKVGLELFWASSSLPLAFIVPATTLSGAVVGWLLASRRPRRERAAPPREVHQLRHRWGPHARNHRDA